MQNFKIKQVFLWGLRRKAEFVPFPAIHAKRTSKPFLARVREPDQRHQGETDDIVTIALKPEIRLLKDRAA